MKPRVLIIEDEAPLVTMLRYNLEREGFAVDAAGDGEEMSLPAASRDFGEIGQLMLVERKPDPVASGKPKARELHEAGPPAHGRSVSFQ
jgi:DNA-binding response OmpR family regulator